MLFHGKLGNFFHKKSFQNVFCFYLCTMDEKKLNFLMQASEVFMKYGIKSVTMDELARQLGISKKTIYTFVKDKNELVESCLLLSHQKENEEINNACDESRNAIDELLTIGMIISERLKSIHPSIFFDLQRYHADVFRRFNEQSQEFIKECVVNNLNKGMSEGYYRENLNVEIMARMYLLFIDTLFKGEVFPITEFGYNTVHSEYFRYHVRGISSRKGLDYLDQIIKTNNYDL